MFRLMSSIVMFCLWAALAQAQVQYDYQTFSIPDPADGRKLLTERQLRGEQHLLDGQKMDWRVSTTTRAVAPITCQASGFTRLPQSTRQGPDALTMNNAGTVGGSDDSAERITVGFIQKVTGECTIVRVPNARATYVTALADNEAAAGWYIDPYGSRPTGPGILQHHGYRRSPDGTISPLTFGTGPSALYPRGLNLAGDVVWGGYLDIPTTCPSPNECRVENYQAGWCDSSNNCAVLTSPDGRILTVADVNNVRQALAYSGPTIGGAGNAVWIIDLNETPPKFQELTLPEPSKNYVFYDVSPQGIDDNGMIVGSFTEQQAPGFCRFPHLCLNTVRNFVGWPQGRLPKLHGFGLP
jgi:hypothetical protein